MRVTERMKSQGSTHGRLFVDGFDEKLLVGEADVPDLAPREADLGSQSEWCLRA